VEGLKTQAPLQTRVGIATGLVVVGDLVGSGEAQERGIVGETPNLAARLQGMAEPDTIVIAESTRKLLGTLFELNDLGLTDLKGIAQPVPVWTVTRASSIASRFEALHASGLTSLVGREEELELLLRRWAKAKSGQGQVVLLSGEPGIGKSRLTAALLEHLAPEPHTRLRYFCSPQHTDSALYPIIGQMERAAGLARENTPQVKLDKLGALLAQTSTSLGDMSLIAEMLSLPNDGRYPALDFLPQQRRQRTMEALLTQLQALTRRSPVLMILEDAHWTDPTSLEVFSLVVHKIRTIRALLVLTFRPEFEPPWIGQPHVTPITVNRLGERDVEALIDRVVGNQQLPASLRQDIIERSDGIPLFVEEMTKAVLEAGSQKTAEHIVATALPPPSAVPASLQASLMARLDRLGPTKEVAQIGAAIGREYSHALVAAAARKPETELLTALDRLMQSGLLFRQGVPPHATYLFKHALVQEAAYGTLLRQPRRALHARIAEALESQFADLVESRPETLARHCTEAGQIEKAAGLWGKAGRRSLERSALVEAVEQLTRALAQVETLPSTPARRRHQINLQVALMAPLMHVKGYAAPETRAAAERARQLIEAAEALGEAPEDPLQIFSALYGIWTGHMVAFDGDLVRQLADEFLVLAEKQARTAPRVIGHRMVAASSLITGEITDALSHFDQAVALYDPPEHGALALTFVLDARVAALALRALARWILGFPDAALADAGHALNDARGSGLAGTLMYALVRASYTYTFCGQFAISTALVDEALALAIEKSGEPWHAYGILQKGVLLSATGQSPEAVNMLTSGIAAYRTTGGLLYLPLYISHLAHAHSEVGNLNDAWRCIDEAMNLANATKERWCEAEIHRTAGEIALKSPERDEAKAGDYFKRALTVARHQQAKSWELRTAMSLARLRRDQGRPREGFELLAPVYNLFTEGFDTRDLIGAKVLLKALTP
jgi:predicted ATPase